MKCEHCGSEITEYIRLKNKSGYHELVHKPDCIVFNIKRGVKDEYKTTG
jgi:hypothetical protein